MNIYFIEGRWIYAKYQTCFGFEELYEYYQTSILWKQGVPYKKNGHGQCALIDMRELDELDQQKALLQLMTKLDEAKASVRDVAKISEKENT